MELRRVVVTGIGAVSPLGNDVKTTWQSMIEGKSGAALVESFDTTLFKTHFACEVKNFNIENLLDRKEARKLDRYSHFAVWTAHEAMEDSGLDLEKENRKRIGVVFASGMGGMTTLDTDIAEFATGNGVPHYNPFYIPKAILNMAAGHISLRYGLQGPNFAVASACSSSGHAIAVACDQIRLGRAEIMLTGGSEASISTSGIGGFNALHAISTRNDSVQTASRPFSKSRDGFVMGEGGACLILEEYNHAIARGAKIYAELVGYGLNADAYHMTAPDPEGRGAADVMQLAMEDAGITPADVDYINTHGTSTPLGDIAEVKAIQRVWGEDAYRLNISSTKSMTGHLLGGTAAIEAMATILALHDGIVPPTINHEEGDEDEQIDYRLNFTFNQAQKRELRYALTNTFGFGGHNVCLAFKKYIEQ
ncbi:MAG: beta-ketoacyl-ACP synthase II [Paludibacteraceae bacterium]|nr:beta-ketoacyl-ACP synthase II [Paludibacteraceae bacterium]